MTGQMLKEALARLWKYRQLPSPLTAEEKRLEQRLLSEAPAGQRLDRHTSAAIRAAAYRRWRRRTIMRQTAQTLQGVLVLALLLVVAVGALIWWRATNTPAVGSATAEATSDNGLAGGRTLITFAAPEGERSRYEAVIALFNELNEEIEVQFVSLPLRQGEPLSRLEMAETADTVSIYAPPQGDDVGYFLNVGPLMDSDLSFNAQDFWPGALDGCRSGGYVYGLPLMLDFNFLFYDEAAFRDAGLEVPHPGWTWEAFVLAAQKLTVQENGLVTRYGFADLRDLLLMLTPMIESNLVEGTLELDQLAPFLQDVEGLVAQNAVAVTELAADQTDQELNRLILEGGAAMWLDPAVNLTWRRSNLGSQINYVPLPVLGAIEQTSPAYAACVGVSAGSREPDAAWTWVKFLASNPPVTEETTLPANQLVAAGRAGRLTPDSPLGYAVEHAWFTSDWTTLAGVRDTLYRALAGKIDVGDVVSQVLPLPATATPAPPSQPIVVAPPPATPGSGVQQIRFYENPYAYAELVAEFQRQHPTIRVTVSLDLPGSPSRSFTIYDVAENYDCLAWRFANWFPVERDSFYALSPFLDQEPASLRQDFYPGTLEQLSTNGEVIALPLSLQPLVVRYQARRLDEMGLMPPSDEWTLADLVALAEQLADDDETRPVYGFVTGFTANNTELSPWLAAEQGLKLWDVAANPPVVNIDSPDVAAVVRQWTALVQQYAIYPQIGPGSQRVPETAVEPYRLIENNRVALWLEIVGNTIGGGGTINRRLNLLPLPQMQAQLEQPMITGLYISRRTLAPSACWEWLKFLTEQPAAIVGVPARESVAGSRRWETAVGAENAALFRLALERHMSQVKPEAVPSFYTIPLERWWADVLMAAYEGQSFETVMAAAQQKAETYLVCISQVDPPTSQDAERCARQADPAYKSFDELYANE